MISFTIHGQPPSKSNSYKLTSRGSFASMYKTKALKQYEQDFYTQTPGSLRGLSISTPVAVTVHCYFRSRRSDLDNAAKAILDCLQHAGVIRNDNTVYELHMTKTVDKNNPRAEIEIHKLMEDG